MGLNAELNNKGITETFLSENYSNVFSNIIKELNSDKKLDSITELFKDAGIHKISTPDYIFHN